ncbi:hypothetical protein MRX96_055120 [Rhipicephalus microplus]
MTHIMSMYAGSVSSLQALRCCQGSVPRMLSAATIPVDSPDHITPAGAHLSRKCALLVRDVMPLRKSWNHIDAGVHVANMNSFGVEVVDITTDEASMKPSGRHVNTS